MECLRQDYIKFQTSVALENLLLFVTVIKAVKSIVPTKSLSVLRQGYPSLVLSSLSFVITICLSLELDNIFQLVRRIF